MKIGEMLVADGRLPPEGLVEALRTQARRGGRLGTNLLELGLVGEEALLETLGRQRSSRTVSRSELEDVPASVVRLIPARLADRYGIVPFRLKGRTLFVASKDVGDPLKEDEIGFLTSAMVRSCIALEVRIYEALERYYRVEGATRYQALAKRLAARENGGSRNGAAVAVDAPAPVADDAPESAAAPPVGEPRPAASPPAASPPAASPPAASPPAASRTARTAPPPPAKPEGPRFIELDEEDAALLGRSPSDAAPWPPPGEPVILEPTPLPWLARERAAEPGPEPETETGAETAGAAAGPEETPASMPLPTSEPSVLRVARASGRGQVELSVEEWLRNAVSELKHAEIRDDVADVLLAFCEPFLRRRLMLVARKDRVVGWRGEGDGVEPENVRAIEIPADEPSVFFGLTGADSFWLGALPPLEANQALVAGLGGTFPKDCVVLPVSLRSRVVCYLYGDNLDQGVTGVPVAELRRLTAKAGLAFEIYILKNKMRML